MGLVAIRDSKKHKNFNQLINYFVDDNWRFSQIKDLPKLVIKCKNQD